MFAAAWVPIARITNLVGTADCEFTFRVPFPCQVIEMHSAADAADATDKYAAILYQGSTVLLTGTTVVTTDATYVDAADQVFLNTAIDYKIKVDFSGTATNVKGVSITLWAVPHR